MRLAETQNDPEFQRLDPAAKSIVLDKLSSQDQEFSALAPEAQKIVRDKLMQNRIPQPGTPDPVGPYYEDQFRKGVGALYELPFTALNYAAKNTAEFLHLPFTPVGPSHEAIEKFMEIKNIEVPRDQYGKPRKSVEYTGAIANFIGAGLAPGLGVVAAAERKIVAAIVETLASAASAEGAVSGKDVGRQVAEQFGGDPKRGEEIGEFAGSLIGPGAVALGANKIQQLTSKAGAVVQEKTGIGGGLSDEAQHAAAKTMANEELQKSVKAAPATEKNLAESIEVAGEIPGFKPTLGQATGAPGIVAIEQRLSKKSPESLAKAAERESTNTAAIKGFEERAFPTTKTQVTQGAKTLASERTRKFDKELNRVNSEIKDLSEKYQFQDNAATGARLIAKRNEAHALVRAEKNRRYNEAYDIADAHGVAESIEDEVTIVRKISALNPGQSMPPIYSKVLEAFDPENPKVPFRILHSLYKGANADILAANLSGRAEQSYYASKIKDSLADKMAKYTSEEHGNLGAALGEANSFYKDQYRRVFYEGAGGRMVNPGKFGAVTNEEDIVRNLLFKPNNARGMEEFAEIYGSDPEAAQLLKNGIMDVFAKDVVVDGEIKSSRVETFMKKYDQALARVPGVKEELRATDTMNDSLLMRRSMLEAASDKFDKSVVAKIAKTEDAEAVISKALASPMEMRGLLATAKTPAQKQSVASAIAHKIAQEKDPYQYIADNKKTVQPAMDALGKGHWKNLVILSKAKEIAGRTVAPTHVELSKLEDVGEKIIGTPVKGIFSNIQNAVKGYQSKGYMTLHLAGRYIYKVRTADTNKLLEAAIYDTDLAEALKNVANKKPTAQAVNVLAHHAYAHGIRVVTYASEDQGD